ncbi:unnamed protein product, partial [Rotaria magnacalcarata]
NSETASTNFEPSNDAQLSSTNVEASTNDDSSEHGSRRLNDDNQNNSYFQMDYDTTDQVIQKQRQAFMTLSRILTAARKDSKIFAR